MEVDTRSISIRRIVKYIHPQRAGYASARCLLHSRVIEAPPKNTGVCLVRKLLHQGG